MTPRIAVDVRMVQHSGIGTYIRNLVPRVIQALPDRRFVLITRPGTDRLDGTLERWGGRVESIVCRSDIYSLGQQWELPRRVRADLWWIPHYDVPVFTRTPLVVTVHDLAHLALPELYGGPLRSRYARWMLDVVRRRARQLIFVSEFTSREFTRYVGEPAGTASVIYSGVDQSWRAPAAGGPPHPRPYILFVGSVKPHKNLSGLLAAFARIAPAVPHDLIVAGASSGMRTVDRSSLRPPESITRRVHFVGMVDDALLRRYVAHAALLAFPSRYEGFGLPALEAMAAGCACVVSRAASLPEVCGAAAAYCDPDDPADIARQIARVLTDTAFREQLVRDGRVRAGAFDWDTTAHATSRVVAAGLDQL